MSVMDLLTLENPVFKSYLFYSCILVLKVLFMAPMTSRQRFSSKACISPEDYITFITGPRPETPKIDEKVERVRRAHLNDLENITFFFVAAFAYLLTNPSAWLAINLIRAFTIARIAHTFVYAVVVIPQPARAIAWAIGYGITIYMSIVSICTFY